MTVEREAVRFLSDGTECAGWFYPGTNGGCVIMAGGLAVTKEPATDLFAARFAAAGFAVLAFDYRRLGGSDGTPRLVLPVRDQQGDWQAAIDVARTRPGVDPARIALWGFSASAGHLLPVAARNPDLAAVIAQTPNVGGLGSVRAVARYQKPLAMLRFTARGIADALGGLIGRRPRLVPLVGAPGTVSMLTTPDAQLGAQALQADRHPEWQQVVAARSTLGIASYRPGRFASRIQVPLLVLVCDDDSSTPAALSLRVAQRVTQAEVVHLPGGHYEPFLGGHDAAVEAEVSFLRRHVLAPVAATA